MGCRVCGGEGVVGACDLSEQRSKELEELGRGVGVDVDGWGRRGGCWGMRDGGGSDIGKRGRESGGDGRRREKMEMLWHGIWPSIEMVVGHSWGDGEGL